MIKVGVTGSNGFIGWHLCRTLELAPNQFELIEFKRDWFNDCFKLDTYVSKCDIIVHLAGLNRHSEESAIYDTNVDLSVKLIESFKRIVFKVKLYFLHLFKRREITHLEIQKKWPENYLQIGLVNLMPLFMD